jgi:recombination protein RecR
MPDFAEPLARLINEFKRLPGIGQKSAQRIAFHVLRAGRDDAAHLAQAILDVKEKLGLCIVCNNISDRELCTYCSDARRDPAIVCVVEEPHSIVGIETTRQFEGRYHLRHGVGAANAVRRGCATISGAVFSSRDE